jgi:hypothetical protein
MFLQVKNGWSLRLKYLPPSLRRLSRKCGSLNVYGPPRSFTGNFAFFFFYLRKEPALKTVCVFIRKDHCMKLLISKIHETLAISV